MKRKEQKYTGVLWNIRWNGIWMTYVSIICLRKSSLIPFSFHTKGTSPRNGFHLHLKKQVSNFIFAPSIIKTGVWSQRSGTCIYRGISKWHFSFKWVNNNCKRSSSLWEYFIFWANIDMQGFFSATLKQSICFYFPEHLPMSGNGVSVLP